MDREEHASFQVRRAFEKHCLPNAAESRRWKTFFSQHRRPASPAASIKPTASEQYRSRPCDQDAENHAPFGCSTAPRTNPLSPALETTITRIFYQESRRTSRGHRHRRDPTGLTDSPIRTLHSGPDPLFRTRPKPERIRPLPTKAHQPAIDPAQRRASLQSPVVRGAARLPRRIGGRSNTTTANP